ADPALRCMEGVQGREQQRAVALGLVTAANHPVVGRDRGSQQRIDRTTFLVRRLRRHQMEVHQGTSACSLSIRIAVALNSAVPDFGSAASIVSRFVSTSSGKCSVMNARPARSAEETYTGASTSP